MTRKIIKKSSTSTSSTTLSKCFMIRFNHTNTKENILQFIDHQLIRVIFTKLRNLSRENCRTEKSPIYVDYTTIFRNSNYRETIRNSVDRFKINLENIENDELISISFSIDIYA
jgi:hypothetical protein